MECQGRVLGQLHIVEGGPPCPFTECLLPARCIGSQVLGIGLVLCIQMLKSELQDLVISRTCVNLALQFKAIG